jgi:hypothetical protein
MSTPALPRPNGRRVALGFVLAPALAAAAFSVVEGDSSPTMFVAAMLYGALPATIVLGIPAYFILRNWCRPHVATIVLVGGLIAIIPWVLLFIIGGPEQGQVGNCVTTINGQMTWCGFVGALEVLAEIFAFGAFGGLVFWFCAVWHAGLLDEQPQPENDAQA